jgi:alpha-1,3-rhamnosyl/mannosyltransferase
VISYNDATLLLRCLDGITKLDESIGILIIDNGSNPPVQVNHEGPHAVRVIRLKGRASYAAALNLGLETLQTEYEYIWVLDSDQVPSQDTLCQLITDISPKSVGGVGALQVDPTGRPLFSGGRFPSAIAHLYDCAIGPGLRRSKGLRFVDFLPMGGMLIRSEALSRLPYKVDEESVWGSHDLDLCFRLKALGWAFVLDTSVSIQHDIDSPLKPQIGDRLAMGVRSLMWWASKSRGRKYAKRLRLAMWLCAAAKMVVFRGMGNIDGYRTTRHLLHLLGNR